MSETPSVILKDYASDLRKQVILFSDISEYVEPTELELAKNEIARIQNAVSSRLDGQAKQKFDYAMKEASLGVKALIRSIHRGKDSSKQFFKDASEVADFLRSAASLLSLFPISFFIMP